MQSHFPLSDFPLLTAAFRLPVPTKALPSSGPWPQASGLSTSIPFHFSKKNTYLFQEETQIQAQMELFKILVTVAMLFLISDYDPFLNLP